MTEKECRRCFECKGRVHHWVENSDAEQVADAEYFCKHCETSGVRCPDCDGDGYSRKPSLGDEPCELCKGEGVLEMKDDLPSVVHASENPDRLLVDDVTSDSQVDHEARKQWYRETVSKRGIILLTEPEPEPEPQDVKPKQWSITVGGCLYEDEQIIKDALAVLYEVALPTFGICGNKNDHEKRKRVWMLLDQVSKELVDEVPSIEQLC